MGCNDCSRWWNYREQPKRRKFDLLSAWSL